MKTKIYLRFLTFFGALMMLPLLAAAETEADASDPLPVGPQTAIPSEGSEKTAKSAAVASALRVIFLAIKHGVPTYNEGNPGACAAIYEVAAVAIVNLGTLLPQGVREPLSKALSQMKTEQDVQKRAWLLRRGLDSAANAMSAQQSSE